MVNIRSLVIIHVQENNTLPLPVEKVIRLLPKALNSDKGMQGSLKAYPATATKQRQ
jgi:hypothetical protein